MIKIEIKSIFGKVIFTYEKENATIKDAVLEAIKAAANLRYANLRYANLRYANLRYANLRYADLSYADLSYANLSSADLSSADLSSANLSSADLSSADLSYANLSSANLDKRYIQIACIGSRKGMTTYCFEDDFIWCGCFKGSLNEFEAQVSLTHGKNEVYLKEYLGFINYLKSLK